MWNKALFFLCLSVFLGCAAKKILKPTAVQPIPDTIHKVVQNTPNYLSPLKLAAIRQAQINFTTLNAKAETKLALGTDTHDVTLNIRIKQDAQIWVSITALMGIEVARALITPDSIKIINRLQSTYVNQPFSFIYKYTNKQVDFKTLQALFTGNIAPNLLSDTTQIDTAAGNMVLKGNLADLGYKLFLNPTLKVTGTTLASPARGQSLQVDNANFVQTAKGSFPMSVNMTSVVNQKQIQIELNFTRTEFDRPLEFPFTIPSRYSPVN